MKLAVFSDIHGNLEALQAFVADASKREIDRYTCLGDIVGYGANPNECIDIVRGLPKCNIILGNHDAATVWLTSPYGMSDGAKKAILWTMDVLTVDNTAFLKSLSPVIVMGDMNFSHANPYNPQAWHYIHNRKYAVRAFSGSKERILFVGHTHRPLAITRRNFFKIILEKPEDSTTVSVRQANRRIFNCGSIGQPRDRNPKSSYLIYDTRKEEITFYRLSYDFNETGRKIIDAGLSEYLARRLKRGR